MDVLIIDDHAMFRQGLRLLLQDLDGSQRFTEVGSCEEAVAMPPAYEPHLILLDLHMPGTKDMRAITEVRERYDSARIVVVTGEDDSKLVLRAIDNGAAGFVPKTSSGSLLIAALKVVLAGGTYLPDSALQDTVVNSADRTGLLKLSERQEQVLTLAISGQPNKTIARKINIAEGTVKAHLSAAFRALGVSNRTQAVYAAADLGILPPEYKDT